MSNLIDAKKENDKGKKKKKATQSTGRTVTPEMRQGWEDYRTYLEREGLYGDPKLNTSFGKTLFLEWTKKNPQYNLSWESLPAIGQELSAQKREIGQKMQQGKMTMNIPFEEFNPTDVANLKTKNPWWPGVEFTSQGFAPHEEVQYDAKGNVIKKTLTDIKQAGQVRKTL